MNEEIRDTFVKKVMKKVEEMKLWQLMNSKDGFEVVYNDVLKDVEELPESIDKYHALADVLMRGWWWLPGDKNDALFARIVEAAEKGRNDEVMQFVVSREDLKVSYGVRHEFIRDKQIPRLEKLGFVKSLAHEWFWLGKAYFENKETEKGFEAFEKVLSIIKPSDLYYAYAIAATKMERKHLKEYADKDEDKYRLRCAAEEYRLINGKLCRWNQEWYSNGHLISFDLEIDFIFRNASLCDGNFIIEGLRVGDTYTGSDGTTLAYAEDSAEVETPCGTFESCQLWITKHKEATYYTYYKQDVGIVKHVRQCDGVKETRLLKSYDIVGGKGILPSHTGNSWEYVSDNNPKFILHSSRFVMSHADDKKVLLTQNCEIERLGYDDNSWIDMIQHIRNEYCSYKDGKYTLHDVSHAVERARILAQTPMQRAHTKAACSVVERILATDPSFNPDYMHTGHWNFFRKGYALGKGSRLEYMDNYRWSFEWKNVRWGNVSEEALLFNDIYDILQNGTNCIWCDEWVEEGEYVEEFLLWNSYYIKTTIVSEKAGEIATKAGTFNDCIKLSLDIKGFDTGLTYRGGRKEYYFAPGVGIIRTVNYHPGKELAKTVYELTAYEGVGKGFMPVGDGMMRKYEAQNLTDGYIGSAEYTYVVDEDGNIVIFEDRCGIRKKPEIVTQYSSIYGEVIEEDLWRQGKYEESRLRESVNKLQLVLHMLERPKRNRGNAERAVAWFKYSMGMCEFLGEGKGVPRAWLGLYASCCFRAACALFGCGQRDEGYNYLERALELYAKWTEIPDGTPLEVGSKLIFGGVKVIKGSGIIELPDGTTELLQYDWCFQDNSGFMYYSMTVTRGWEWFDSVRNEERFKEFMEHARKLMEKS